MLYRCKADHFDLRMHTKIAQNQAWDPKRHAANPGANPATEGSLFRDGRPKIGLSGFPELLV